MARREFTIRIQTADKRLLREVEQLAKGPAARDLDEANRRIKTLATALVEVAGHCASLQEALETLAKNVVFQERK